MRRHRVLSALMFFPRGGSAHVARALAGELPRHGWDVTLLSGSRGDLDGHGDARRFYAGLRPHVVDFTPALRSGAPLAAPVPMHPSFEDRPGAPDAVMASLDDDAYERQVASWELALRDAGAATMDVLHLHHLTPVNEAARRVAPHVPVVGHLHGTELLMLEAIADGAGWAHGAAWAERMRAWARRCERVVLLSQTAEERAERLLGLDPERCLVLPNGFDPEAFRPRAVDRVAHWRRHLVDEPRGWRPHEEPGSVRYDAAQVEGLADAIVVMSVGRFTEVKRTPLLVEAFAEAREHVRRPAALVVVGGHPGEWEGEHPAETVERIGARDVFLAGWHGHDELPAFLNASDVMALASVREQFGQVLVEAMACGVPPIAVDRFGPGEIVRDGETGWLVEPDDRTSLAEAIVMAIDDPEERARRAAAARREAGERYSWPALAERLARTLDEVGAAGPRPAR
ncbi:MAG TPA: glycosyltransferase family 4 protein [Solirubrobacteraceae bacterium]|nr:glycosyltransferase family 4 protein [Solirubrobacteraceae bacterium]